MSTDETPITDAFHREVIGGPLPAIAPRYREKMRDLERAANAMREAAGRLVSETDGAAHDETCHCARCYTEAAIAQFDALKEKTTK